MKTKRKAVKNVNRIKKFEIMGGSLFIMFSILFFVLSLNSYTNNDTVKNEIKVETEKEMILDEIHPSISPLEKNIVSSPYIQNETENLNEETSIVETEAQTTTEIQTEVETEIETQTETEAEFQTETETQINAIVEHNNYSSLDEYIYSLINTYSGYDTRIDLTYENVYLLGQLIYSEAGIEPYEGQIAVGEVVINRLYSSDEYSNIYDVIFKPGQFDVVTYGTIYNSPSEESIQAAVEAILGESPTNGAIYFDDPRICTSWASRNRPYAVKIGNHQFYY